MYQMLIEQSMDEHQDFLSGPGEPPISSATIRTLSNERASHRSVFWFLLFALVTVSTLLSIQEWMTQKEKIDSNGYNNTKSNHHPRDSWPYNPNTSNPRGMIGSWMGNTWLPPAGWQYYHPSDIQNLYQDVRILWLGDSTGRRTAMTFYELMNATDPNDIPQERLASAQILDIAKLDDEYECMEWMDSPNRPKVCRPFRTGTGEMLNVRTNCDYDLENFFDDEMTGRSNVTAHVDLIVVANGIWEIDVAKICKDPHGRSINQVLTDLVRLVDEFQQATGTFVLFRTSGYSDHGPESQRQVQELNHFLMNEIDSLTARYVQAGGLLRLAYINWGDAVLPRSFGNNRIVGNNKAHYGVEPRLTMIQQMTNYLVDRGFFE